MTRPLRELQQSLGFVLVGRQFFVLKMQLVFGVSAFRYLTCRGNRMATQFQLGDDVSAEGAQGGQLVGVQRSRLAIHHAQRSQRVAIGCYQRRAGVEADVRLLGHEGIVDETLVAAGIVDFHHVVAMENGVRAEGNFPRRSREAGPDFRFEPLTRFVHERNQRDRSLADRGGDQGEVVERLFWRRVEHVESAKRFKPVGLFGGKRRFHDDLMLV